MKEKIINNIALITPRLSCHYANLDNKNLVINLYNEKGSTDFLHGINAEQDFELGKKCYPDYKNFGSYLIFENDTNKFIGFGGIQKQEPMRDGSLVLEDEIEFLIMISKYFGGLGYAYEFSSIFLKKFFTLFPHLTIPARVNKENLACIKLLTKLGFKRVGEVDYGNYGNKFDLYRIDHKQLII